MTWLWILGILLFLLFLLSMVWIGARAEMKDGELVLDVKLGPALIRVLPQKKMQLSPEKEAAKPVEPAKPATTKTANQCKACPYWQHMDNRKSKTMYCACLQETGHSRICGVERTYQRHRVLSPLSLDAARAAELGVSYGQYKAGGTI